MNEGKEGRAMEEALRYFREAVDAKKCSHCGCFHGLLKAIDINFPESDRPEVFNRLVKTGRERLSDVRYDCFGCEICYPPAVLNTLEEGGVIHVVEADSCLSEKPEIREGYPPLAGSYKVLRYHAPVAVCTLNSDELIDPIAAKASSDIGIFGSLKTENIGIERMIQNILANPNIRFLIVCGEDSRKAVGHLSGQSLLALSQNGMDILSGQIIGALGKRPVLKNISREAVDHFRRNVAVIDLIGCSNMEEIVDKARACAELNPMPGEPFSGERIIKPLKGYIPRKMTPDPAGYFIVYVDRIRRVLSLEHYLNDGVLDVVIEGEKASELYFPAIERGLVSLLDHACYVGQELARAEHALLTGEPYTQDAAPEQELLPSMPVDDCSANCGCKRNTL